MKVVLDTNIIVADFNFKKPAALILLQQAKIGMLEVFVPEVVLDEVENKFSQRLEKAHRDITGEIEIIAYLNDEEMRTPVTEEFVACSVKKYRKRIEQLFADHNIRIMPYPKTKHKFLAKKAMLKKKPFNTNEKGYRDCLIWENVKSLISGAGEEIASSPELIFITDNHTDFMSGEGLHEDLIEELDQADLQTETIAVYRNLQDFGDRVMKLYLTQEDIFKGRLKNDEFWDFKLKNIITEYLDENYSGHNLSDFEFVAPGDFAEDEREITGYHEDFDIKNLSVKKLNADEFVVDLNIDIETELEFFVDKSDYYSASEVSYGVIDFDWNDHVMLVSQTEIISFAVTMIINSKLESKSFEMNKIDED